MESSLRVFVVEDHNMMRQAIIDQIDREPDLKVVGGAGTARKSMSLVGELRPSIVTVDLRLPDMPGMELIRLLRRQWPEIKVLVLSAYDNTSYIRRAISMNVEGYILKENTAEDLVDALRAVGEGRTAFSPQIVSRVMRVYASSRGTEGEGRWQLTPREAEVVRLMGQGLSNHEIADRLSLSQRTVEKHVSTVIGKLGAHNRGGAVWTARDRGLID